MLVVSIDHHEDVAIGDRTSVRLSGSASVMYVGMQCIFNAAGCEVCLIVPIKLET